jgi:hypothetical protein
LLAPCEHARLQLTIHAVTAHVTSLSSQANAACRALLSQHAPHRLLVVAEAQGSGVSEATAVLYTQVGAESCFNAAWACCLQLTSWSTLPPGFAQVPLPRSAWDDSSGFVTLTMYATAETRAGLEGRMLQSAPSNYLAHAAAGALLR